MAKNSGPSKSDVENNVPGWDQVGFGSGGSSSSGGSSGSSAGSSSHSSGGSSGGGSSGGSSGSSAYDRNTGIDYGRNQGLAGQTVQQGRYQVTYDDLGYVKGSVKTSDSPGYVVDGVYYPGSQIPGRGTSGNGSLTHGSGNGGYGGGGSDFTQYLKDLYAANTAAQLAALENAYKQNTADLTAGAQKIPKTYTAARNDAAAQNEIARRNFSEYAAARGLNTGTGGQAALANSSALQGNLSRIGTGEADALSENALAQQKLDAQYKNAAAQAQAGGDSQLASALYQEYVRQENASAAARQAAQAQANWAAQFNAANSQWQQQFQNGANQWQQEFDYSKELNQQKYAYSMASTMLANGEMPDAATLAAAGISSADAMNMMMGAVQKQSPAYRSGSAAKPKAGGYENGGLTTEQVKQLQSAYGAAPDGLWGGDSSAAAGGMTADQAWAKYSETKLPDYEVIRNNSSSGAYGPQYGMVLGMAQAMKTDGKSIAEIARYLQQSVVNGAINEAGAGTISSAVGI